MAVDTHHPQYTAQRQAEWRLMRDAAEGESAVKGRGPTYLPVPGGFNAMQDGGKAAYEAYKMRASFPEILAPSLAAMIGIAHGKEIQIEIPSALEYLWEDADGEGMPLEVFHRKITRELLLIGRYGVLTEAPEGGGEPYLAGYIGESLINWDLDFFVLDESGPVRRGFDWEDETRYRVLALDGGRYVQAIYSGKTGAAQGSAEPVAMGGKPLDFVPFVVASSVDLRPDIRTAPLIGVARSALAIYQLDADQRHQLFMSGQETLVAINGDAPPYVGAGVVHSMMGSENVTPDLKYVSPTCSGIEAHAEKIKDLREAAVMAGARLLEQSDNVQESGNARALRFASETATLTSVLQSSCALLERALRNVAAMKGLDGEAITVKAPATLLDTTMTPADAQALMALWQQGAISYQTLFENLLRGGIASPERDADAEFALRDAEDVGEEDESEADGFIPAGEAR